LEAAAARNLDERHELVGQIETGRHVVPGMSHGSQGSGARGQESGTSGQGRPINVASSGATHEAVLVAGASRGGRLGGPIKCMDKCKLRARRKNCHDRSATRLLQAARNWAGGSVL